MFEWALGMWPFKDTFYTNTSHRENLPANGQDKGQQEDQPYTHTVLAALSGGGVAPGDVIGGTNVPLVMSTCRQDGTLLKPTTPSAFIDRYWTEHAGGEGVGSGIEGGVHATANVTSVGEAASGETVMQGHVWKWREWFNMAGNGWND